MIQSWVRHPLFWIGLALRLATIAALAWSGWTPWQHGDVYAVTTFPAGPTSWIVIVPWTSLLRSVGLDSSFGAVSVILLADFGMLLGLKALLGLRHSVLLKLYWLSPVVLILAYPSLAVTELLGATLLCWALVSVRNARPIWAGFISIAAAASSLSGVFAIPLFFIYYLRNRALRSQLNPFAAAVALCAAACLFSQALLGGYNVARALTSPWFLRTADMSVGTGAASSPIYLFPIAYALTLFVVWRMRRLAPEVFPILCGLVFLVLSMFSGSWPSWLLWALPLLIFVQYHSGTIAVGLINLLAASCILANVEPFSTFAASASVATCIVVIASIWKYTVLTNDLLRIAKRPLVIGIAGDSGAGKDTLVDSISNLFDTQSVVRLSGDDYHFWDRHKPMWQVMTHLNPRANDLEKFARDLTALADGKNIESPHYDHSSGQKSRPLRIRSNDFIIASGLHALYLPLLRESYDLGIYLDIDEDLRKFLKLQRDVKQRGHTPERVLAAIADREADAERFIRPQREHAQLVLSLCPTNPRLLRHASEKSNLRLKLIARSHQGFHEENLVRALVGICGLHVDIELGGEDGKIMLSIEGDTHADDIALAAKTLVPQLLPLLRNEPHWEDGVKGLMQLIVLTHLNQALRRRLI